MAGIFANLQGKLHWHANEFLTRCPALLARLGLPLTVVDQFGTPGDTILCAIICRELKSRHPCLYINCITPNPSLLQHDPNIDSLNESRTFFSINFQYLELINRKDANTNVLFPTFSKLGITDYHYEARVYLTDEEIAWAKRTVGGMQRPIVTINAMSREAVKVWPLDYWQSLVGRLKNSASIVQLGDDREPLLEGVTRLAGKLSMRESMAILGHATLHIGPDSFLMHAANGVGVPSIIIFGGSRPVSCLGYTSNENMGVSIDCGPCWIHTSHGQICPHSVKCMAMISPEEVISAAEQRLRPGNKHMQLHTVDMGGVGLP